MRNPVQTLRGTSWDAFRRAFPQRPEPLYVRQGVIEAPYEQVLSLLTTARAGKASQDNAFLLNPKGVPDGVELRGGPTRFGVGHGTVDADPERGLFAIQGGWWYRGEYTVKPHEKGALLTLRVYNVAADKRVLVPLVQFGMDQAVTDGFDQALADIRAFLG
ncbi:hypothetical protein Lesp02_85000 [Lentzea sp. NBRC 105346]|uniref:hypothetical protein n=1 Tax=Lentzea sp. NBRC 105346 TaxID=3032205 RepID=UPI0024A1D60F|nr:hypothetical protein [Lentzea sp. NBRC 105346]GLZ36313.1 hypothetical protein Lesp02_85000 [Lentzea sp. NBRC 105346]